MIRRKIIVFYFKVKIPDSETIRYNNSSVKPDCGTVGPRSRIPTNPSHPKALVITNFVGAFFGRVRKITNRRPTVFQNYLPNFLVVFRDGLLGNCFDGQTAGCTR